MRRDLADEEKAVLEALLSLEFEGAQELRAQLATVKLVGQCECGCATIELDVDRAHAPQAAIEGLVPAEGSVRRPGSDEVQGGIILFASNGYLSALEIYNFDDEPIRKFPPLTQIDFFLT